MSIHGVNQQVSIGGNVTQSVISTGDNALNGIAWRLYSLKVWKEEGPASEIGLDAALKAVEHMVNPVGLGVEWNGKEYILYSFESRK